MPVYTVPLCILTGISCFGLGALVQQEISYKRIKKSMSLDPYVYQSRQSIYKALELLGLEKPPIGNACEDSDFACFISWLRESWQAVLAFITQGFDPGKEETENNDESQSLSNIMKYGFPSMTDIRVYKNYVLSYDRRNRIAHWVCEHLSAECICNQMRRSDLEKDPEILTDNGIPLMFRATVHDYMHNKWLMGSFASPSNHKCNSLFYNETFMITNAVPVHEGLRSKVWLRLEQYVRMQALRSGHVYVYTGPLFMPERLGLREWVVHHNVIGMNTVAVPTHFFKVIVSEHKNKGELPFMEGYVVPNSEIEEISDLRVYLSDIRDIEHFAGLQFCDGVRRVQFYK